MSANQSTIFFLLQQDGILLINQSESIFYLYMQNYFVFILYTKNDEQIKSKKKFKEKKSNRI